MLFRSIEGTAQIRAELADIERHAVQAGGTSTLVSMLMAADPGAAFLAAETGVQREVIKAIGSIQILEGTVAGQGFNPALVRFPWQESADAAKA